MIIGYKRPVGGEDAFWYAKFKGVDRKYIRMLAGLSLPILDRVSGAVVIIGELYKQTGPQDLTALACKVGSWPEVENALTQFRKDMKFDHVICDREEAREVIFRMPGVHFGLNEIPLSTYTAPEYACTEVGRAKTDQMIAEGRLHIEDATSQLDLEPEAGMRALCSVVIWASDFSRAYYSPTRKREPGSGRILGVEGL